jgi:hypothetical protein
MMILGLLSLASLTTSTATIPSQEYRAYSALSYNYLELGLNRDEGGDSGDVGWAGSYSINESIYVFAAHTNSTIGFEQATMHRPKMRVGLGAHETLEAGMANMDVELDLYASAAYANIDGPWGTEPGGVYAAGMRSKLTDQLEVSAGLEAVAIDGAEDTYLTLGGVFDLTERFGMSVSYAQGDDGRSFMVGLRMYL